MGIASLRTDMDKDAQNVQDLNEPVQDVSDTYRSRSIIEHVSGSDATPAWVEETDVKWLNALESVSGSPTESQLLGSDSTETTMHIDQSHLPALDFPNAFELQSVTAPSAQPILVQSAQSDWTEMLEACEPDSQGPDTNWLGLGGLTSRHKLFLEDHLDYSLCAATGEGIAVRKVSMVVEQCDRDTLNYLLDMTSPLKCEVKVEISP
jgi:hypothetical protein